MSFQLVNGYVCFNCADISLAQKGENPAHPPGSVSNPMGTTPNGPYPLNGAKAVDASGAVTFGGALASQPPAPAPAPSAPAYQPGAKVSTSA